MQSLKLSLEQASMIEILDKSGRMVKGAYLMASEQDQAIDISELTDGIYMIRITSGPKMQTYPLLKKYGDTILGSKNTR